MNPVGSLPNHENLTLFDGTPLQGLLEARWIGFFELFVPDPPRGSMIPQLYKIAQNTLNFPIDAVNSYHYSTDNRFSNRFYCRECISPLLFGIPGKNHSL